MAISLITANQANAMPPAQNAQKVSEAKAVSGTRNSDTVTISRQAQKAAVEAANAALAIAAAQAANAEQNTANT